MDDGIGIPAPSPTGGVSEGRSSARTSVGEAAARERSGDARREEVKESAVGLGLVVARWRKRRGSVEEVEAETAMARRGSGDERGRRGEGQVREPLVF